MRGSVFTVVLLSVLIVGCQGPGMHGGFYQSPYHASPVDGPGPGVMPEHFHPGGAPGHFHSGPGAMPGQYQPVSLTPQDMMPPFGAMQAPPPSVPTSQINFLGVESLVIRYNARSPRAFDSDPLVCPGFRDFPQGNIYRLKLSNIPGHTGKELFPTLEIAPTAARTQAFLAHSSIPVEFNDNDFDQVFSGNYVTKVIYLPNPEFQGIAMSGVGTLVNTQLQPGVDPIVEASKRGTILAVIRMGNKDLTNQPQQPHFAGGPAMGGGMYPPMGGTIPQNLISGVNIPPYGVPMTKTTTGIPGPPQLPQDAYYAPNHSPVIRTEPMPAPPALRTHAAVGQPIPNPYAPPMIAVQPQM